MAKVMKKFLVRIIVGAALTISIVIGSRMAQAQNASGQSSDETRARAAARASRAEALMSVSAMNNARCVCRKPLQEIQTFLLAFQSSILAVAGLGVECSNQSAAKRQKDGSHTESIAPLKLKPMTIDSKKQHKGLGT
jgi:hypothetical protein